MVTQIQNPTNYALKIQKNNRKLDNNNQSKSILPKRWQLITSRIFAALLQIARIRIVTKISKIPNHSTAALDSSPCSILIPRKKKLHQNALFKKSRKRDRNIVYTTIQWQSFMELSSILKASKDEIHGVKKPYPTPTRQLTAILRPNQIANRAGSTNRIAIFRGASILSIL